MVASSSNKGYWHIRLVLDLCQRLYLHEGIESSPPSSEAGGIISLLSDDKNGSESNPRGRLGIWSDLILRAWKMQMALQFFQPNYNFQKTGSLKKISSSLRGKQQIQLFVMAKYFSTRGWNEEATKLEIKKSVSYTIFCDWLTVWPNINPSCFLGLSVLCITTDIQIHWSWRNLQNLNSKIIKEMDLGLDLGP